MENTFKDSEQQESSATWASDKGSCTEAPDGATGQNPGDQRTGATPLSVKEHPSSCSQTSEKLEGLKEKDGTLGLKLTKKNRCGTARKRTRRARLAEAPAGASDGGEPRSASGGQKQIQQEPNTSKATTEQKPQKSRGHAYGPRKRQRSAGALLRVGRLRAPNRLGSLVKPGLLRRASG